MQQADLNNSQCYICRQKKAKNERLKFVEKTKVPGSRKPLKDIILHVARFMKIDITVPSAAELCRKCVQQLIEYDGCVLRLLAVQKRLMEMIERWASTDAGEESSVDEFLVVDTDTAVFQTQKLPEGESVGEQLCIIKIEKLGDAKSIINDFMNENAENASLSNTMIDSVADEDDSLDNEGEPVSSIKPLVACSHCDKTFKNKTCLKYHNDQEHKRKDYRVCPMCNVTAKDEEYLDLHMNVHEGKTENECRYCSKRYTRKVNVIRHMQKHWDKKKFQCEKCGLRFSESTVLYNHKLQHEAEEQPLICSICQQCFKTKRTYKGHMLTHREDRPRYSCQHCGKTFVERYTLKVHLRMHGDSDLQDFEKSNATSTKATSSGDMKTRLTCIICHCKFSSKEQYNQHMERQHDVILKT